MAEGGCVLRRFLESLGGLIRRRWLLILILLAALGGAGALAGPPLYAWYQLAARRSAVERFHPDDAIPHLDACLAVWPGNVEAHLLSARAARLVGDLRA